MPVQQNGIEEEEEEQEEDYALLMFNRETPS